MLFLFPNIAHAQVGDLIARINAAVINPVVGLIFIIAFVLFLWGAMQYIIRPNAPDARETASRHMLWGVIGMFIMFSVFGIMRLIANTLGADVPGL